MKKIYSFMKKNPLPFVMGAFIIGAGGVAFAINRAKILGNQALSMVQGGSNA